MPAAKKKTTEVATKEESAMALPDFLSNFKGDDGKGEIRPEDMITPRIALLQALSPAVINKLPGAEPGVFWHLLAEVPLGTEFKFTPVYRDHQYILWRPRDTDDGGIIARTVDGNTWDNPHQEVEVNYGKGVRVKYNLKSSVKESGLDQWGSQIPADPESPPAAVAYHNVVCLIDGMEDLGPAVLSMSKTSYHSGRELMSKIKLNTKAPLFGQTYRVSAVETTKGENTFYVTKFTASGFVQDSDLFTQAEEYYQSFKDLGLKVNEDDLEQTSAHDDMASALDDPRFDRKETPNEI